MSLTNNANIRTTCNGKKADRVVVCQETGETIKVEFSEEGIYLNAYTEANSVASLATANIISYTVPVGKVFKLASVDYSGDCIGKFDIEIDSVVESRQYSNYTKYQGRFDFGGFDLVAGEILKLIVENRSKGTGDFNGNLQGRLRDA